MHNCVVFMLAIKDVGRIPVATPLLFPLLAALPGSQHGAVVSPGLCSLQPVAKPHPGHGLVWIQQSVQYITLQDSTVQYSTWSTARGVQAVVPLLHHLILLLAAGYMGPARLRVGYRVLSGQSGIT